MQEGIHPEYGPVVFYDRSADKYFLTKSTLVAKAVNLPTIDWEDGNTKLAKADIVVLNGAGYDGWAERRSLTRNARPS